MELLAGLFIGGLLFGGNKCNCPSCIKSRKKADKEFSKWYEKNKGTSASTSPSASTCSSVYLD